MIKYRIEYKFLNLNISEIRDLKLNLLGNKDLILIETIDTAPRIPALNEHITINGISFLVSNISNSYFNEDEVLVNHILISLFDIVKKRKEELEAEKLKKKKEQDLLNDLLKSKEKTKKQREEIEKYDYYKDWIFDNKKYYLSEDDYKWVSK